MELDQIIEIIKTSIKDAYDEGFDDGSTKQAILEIQGRDRFLEELRASQPLNPADGKACPLYVDCRKSCKALQEHEAELAAAD